MKDFYSKFVLTVIALCLLVLIFKPVRVDVFHHKAASETSTSSVNLPW